MRVLVLGGTVFLSRAVAEVARDAGHEVTALARGLSGTVPDGVRLVRGDRDRPDAYADLTGESFDAVVDVSNSVPQVHGALIALSRRVGHWTYVSTCNVYSDDATPGQRAGTAPLREPAPFDARRDDALDDVDLYGAINRACEVAVAETMGFDHSFRCRPGLIVGPGDRSIRFRYWPARLARGGEVLAPGDPDRPAQVVDVRDLAGWIVRAGETGLAGAYDGVAPPVPMAALLERVAAGVGVTPELTWVEQDFLVEHGVGHWAGEDSLPLWLPLPEYAGFMARDSAASVEAGLRIRDLADTARDTLAWERSAAPEPNEADGGISPEREAKLLAEWHSR